MQMRPLLPALPTKQTDYTTTQHPPAWVSKPTFFTMQYLNILVIQLFGESTQNLPGTEELLEYSLQCMQGNVLEAPQTDNTERTFIIVGRAAVPRTGL